MQLPFLCQFSLVSPHAVLLFARFVTNSANDCWHELLLRTGVLSAAQLIVTVGVKKQRGILVFHIHLCCVVTRPSTCVLVL